ncbi:MAG: BatA domain-containing protein [Bacteroidia bacterium]|nr:BatA domain-containing protein [Bacteroidia bacterium]
MNIHFLYPGFLWALTAVSIPIIIHLFNFRRYKKMYFSNIQFLKNVKQQTKAKSRLRHLLVLLLRILAIAALALAFSQPYRTIENAPEIKQQNVIGLYVDNSFSMDAESSYGKLIEVAKKRAAEIIDAYPVNTKFLLSTNNFEPAHQHLINKEQLLEYIMQIDVTPGVVYLSNIFARQQDLIGSAIQDTNCTKGIFFLSDFQKVSSDIQNIINDPDINIHLIPLSTHKANNLYIDSCWFENPVRTYNRTEELFIRITNNSNESYSDISVELFINDSLKSIGSINIESSCSKDLSLSYSNTSTGIHNGRIEISDYPVTYDNTFYFSYNLAKNIGILIINDKNESKYLQALYSNDTYLIVNETAAGNIDFSKFKNNMVIILNEINDISSGLIQELIAFMNNGGTVVIFPEPEVNITGYNEFLSAIKSNLISAIDTQTTNIIDISEQSSIYKNAFEKIEDNADLPVIYKHFIFTNLTQTNDKPLLVTKDGHNILSLCPVGKGKAYIFAISSMEECSNIQKHPIFIPTMYNIALTSQPVQNIYYIIGEKNFIELPDFIAGEHSR